MQWFKGTKLVDFAHDLETKGGFYQTGWCGKKACEEMLKQHKATIRCLLDIKSFDTCFNCSEPSSHDVLIARAY
jgi:hypothetical protein